MRITTQMCMNYSIRNLSSSYGQAVDLSNRISAMRQVMNLQNNPSSAVTGLRMIGLVSKTEQYMSNISTGTAALDLTDAKLSSLKGLLDEAKSLITGAASEGTTNEQRQTNAVELESLLRQIMSIANSQNGERYLFGGTYTDSEPFTSVGKYVIYNGNDQDISVTTGSNSTIAINCTGADAFGNMTSTVSTGNLNSGVSLSTDVSTSLSALNGGSGVTQGKIMVYYSSYPDGLEVDITGCDTLEDVKDRIESATLEASRALDPSACSWLDGSDLDWRDLHDRYVKVTMNPDGNGISLREIDLGEPLPEPTAKEQRKGLDYSGAPGYDAGGGGNGIGAGTVHDKADYIYGDGSGTYAALKVEEVAGNKVAASLGIMGTAKAYDPNNPDSKMDGFIHGTDLNPVVTGSTLLADLEGYNDAVYTITNGGQPGSVSIRETSADNGNVFSNWNLNNLSQGYNTGANGELYARVTRRGAPDNDLYVEVYTQPLDKAKARDLVATGTCSQVDGGTVTLNEANNSGVSGAVGILLPTTVDSGAADLAVEWSENMQAVIHVPAFVEETNPDGSSKDAQNILSGWQITGLDKPPASGYDLNHPATTDLDGNVAVNMRMVENSDGTTSAVLELYRPAYDDQPSVLIASGELSLGVPPLDTAASGRIALTGVEGFEDIGGSVYVEIPADTDISNTGAGAEPILDFNLTATFATVEDLMRAVEEAGIYATAQVSADGKGVEFSSRLAGAYLTVSEDADCYERMNDAYQQLSALDLNGLVNGVNADSSGNVYTEVVYYPADPTRIDGKAVLYSKDGEQTLLDSGYYVRVYSDADALDVSYENRDNSSLAAEGFVAAGAWDGSDPASPYAAGTGSASPLTLEERNNSGVSGTVTLDYYGGRDQAALNADGSYDYAPYNNSRITVAPGGLRTTGAAHATIQEIDVGGFTPGVHCDYSGAAHATISRDGSVTTVSVYRDASRTHMTVKGEMDAATGEVLLYETDKQGNYALDASGSRIKVGTLVVAENTLPDGGSDNFTITAGGLDMSGQARESNLFSTLYDALDAMYANDAEKLHDLIDDAIADIDRLLAAEADVSARSARLTLLSERYSEDIIAYEEVKTATIGMDETTMAKYILQMTAAENAYTASMSVASRYLQMSLLDYL